MAPSPGATVNATVGRTLRAALDGASLGGADFKQATVAARADVSESTLSRFLSGERPISYATYWRLVFAVADLMVEQETAA